MNEFVKFPKIPRLNREWIITEKIDGTNAQITIADGAIATVGSRNRFITPGKTTDNHGFAAWVAENEAFLVQTLGDGTHYGEWYGAGIARNYGLTRKKFALFNTSRWTGLRAYTKAIAVGLTVVPEIMRCENMREMFLFEQDALDVLRSQGSFAEPGFMNPEGIVLYSTSADQLFKVTLENDVMSKGEAERIASNKLGLQVGAQ